MQPPYHGFPFNRFVTNAMWSSELTGHQVYFGAVEATTKELTFRSWVGNTGTLITHSWVAQLI